MSSRPFIPKRKIRLDAHESTAALLRVVESGDSVAAQTARDFLSRTNVDSEKALAQQDRHDASWITFNRFHRDDPWNPRPGTTCGYVQNFRGRSKAWAKERILRLRKAFNSRGLPDPTQHPTVKAAIKSLESELITPPECGVQPLLVEDYLILVASIGRDNLRDLRFCVMVGLGFICLMMPESIAALRVEDVIFVPQGFTVKFSWYGVPRSVDVAQESSAGLCEDMLEWVDRTGLKTGPLFPPFFHGKIVADKAIGKNALTERLKRHLNFAGYDGSKYSWRSLRLGFLVSAKLRDVTDLELFIRAGCFDKSAIGRALRRHGASVPLLATLHDVNPNSIVSLTADTR